MKSNDKSSTVGVLISTSPTAAKLDDGRSVAGYIPKDCVDMAPGDRIVATPTDGGTELTPLFYLQSVADFGPVKSKLATGETVMNVRNVKVRRIAGSRKTKNALIIHNKDGTKRLAAIVVDS